jgi:hypothetical protein
MKFAKKKPKIDQVMSVQIFVTMSFHSTYTPTCISDSLQNLEKSLSVGKVHRNTRLLIVNNLCLFVE